MDRSINRKRNLVDKFISFLNFAKYSLTEPFLLKINRFLYSKNYEVKNDNPLISITIPTFDRGQLLIDRTLPSILSQSYVNFEVLIIGDCCIDNTPEILSGITDPRVKFFNLKKRTKYPNDPKSRWFISGVKPSNYALKISKGKWICYFDDDDIMSPHYLERLLRFAQIGNFEFVAGLYEEDRDGNLNIKGYKEPGKIEFGGHSTWMYRSYLKFFKYNINSWRKSYNRPQDIDLFLRMHNAGVVMENFKEVVSYIRPRPGQKKIGLDARLEKNE